MTGPDRSSSWPDPGSVSHPDRIHGGGGAALVRPAVVVAHSVFCWLPLTMTWVYNQVRFATGTRSIVLADALSDDHIYPWTPVYAASWLDRQFGRARNRYGVSSRQGVFDAAVVREGATILHSHFGDRGWFDLPLASRRRVVHVVSFYGYDLSLLPQAKPLWRRRYGRLFQSANRFFCEGAHMKETLVALGCPREKVAVHPLGVDLARLHFEPRQPPSDDVVRVLVAGTFREKKGIPLALEAVANVRERGYDLRVTVIGDAGGQSREAAEKAAILEVVRRRRLEPVVDFLGFQPYERLLAEAYHHHVFLSPSRTSRDGDDEGGAPVTVIEMSATGMPIVSTKHCDIPGVVIDGVTGYLAVPGDVDDLTLRLEAAVSHPGDWPSLGVAGRRHIEANFDARELGQQLTDTYRDLSAC